MPCERERLKRVRRRIHRRRPDHTAVMAAAPAANKPQSTAVRAVSPASIAPGPASCGDVTGMTVAIPPRPQLPAEPPSYQTGYT